MKERNAIKLSKECQEVFEGATMDKLSWGQPVDMPPWETV
jgi:hypothetical protein